MGLFSIPLIGKAIGGLAKAGVIRGTVGRAFGYAKKNPGTSLVVGGTAIGAVPWGGGGSGFGPPPLPGGRQPQGVVPRTIQRILPGGRSGRELTPYEGTEYDKIGRPIAVYPEPTQRLYVPPGYVVVNLGTKENPQQIGMLKGVARAMGLWKARPKPPITGYDARAIRRAASAQKRVKKLAGNVGLNYCLPKAGKGRFRAKKRARS